MSKNIMFGNDQTLNGTFEKFHAQNIVFHSDATVKLSQDTMANTTSFTVGSKEINPGVTHMVVADKFKVRSDARLKSEIRKLKDCLGTLSQITGVEYKFKNAKTKSFGMIAQDVKEIIPEVVSQDDDGYFNISYIDLIPFLVESIKEMNERVDALSRKIDSL